MNTLMKYHNQFMVRTFAPFLSIETGIPEEDIAASWMRLMMGEAAIPHDKGESESIDLFSPSANAHAITDLMLTDDNTLLDHAQELIAYLDNTASTIEMPVSVDATEKPVIRRRASNKMKLEELKEECLKRGLPDVGTKTALITSIKNYDVQHPFPNSSRKTSGSNQVHKKKSSQVSVKADSQVSVKADSQVSAKPEKGSSQLTLSQMMDTFKNNSSCSTNSDKVTSMEVTSTPIDTPHLVVREKKRRVNPDEEEEEIKSKKPKLDFSVTEEKPKPVTEDKPKPKPVMEDKPKPKPVMEDKPKPVIEEKPKPVIEEKPKAVMEEKPKPKSVTEEKPLKKKEKPKLKLVVTDSEDDEDSEIFCDMKATIESAIFDSDDEIMRQARKRVQQKVKPPPSSPEVDTKKVGMSSNFLKRRPPQSKITEAEAVLRFKKSVDPSKPVILPAYIKCRGPSEGEEEIPINKLKLKQRVTRSPSPAAEASTNENKEDDNMEVDDGEKRKPLYIRHDAPYQGPMLMTKEKNIITKPRPVLPPIVKIMNALKRQVELRRDKYGNVYHEETGIAFTRAEQKMDGAVTRLAIGMLDKGARELRRFTHVDLDTCKEHGFKYRTPDYLYEK